MPASTTQGGVLLLGPGLLPGSPGLGARRGIRVLREPGGWDRLFTLGDSQLLAEGAELALTGDVSTCPLDALPCLPASASGTVSGGPASTREPGSRLMSQQPCFPASKHPRMQRNPGPDRASNSHVTPQRKRRGGELAPPSSLSGFRATCGDGFRHEGGREHVRRDWHRDAGLSCVSEQGRRGLLGDGPAGG